jgi:hypothetical protein
MDTADTEGKAGKVRMRHCGEERSRELNPLNRGTWGHLRDAVARDAFCPRLGPPEARDNAASA